MKKWSDGNFVNDWQGEPPLGDITPEGLTRSAFEAYIGDALFPGIECGWMVRDVLAFSEPFRLDHSKLKVGDVTKQMSVPWQADFFACQEEEGTAWWPSQRPDDVFPEAGGPEVPWTRDLASSGTEMVHRWHRLGVVALRCGQCVETECDKRLPC